MLPQPSPSLATLGDAIRSMQSEASGGQASPAPISDVLNESLDAVSTDAVPAGAPAAAATDDRDLNIGAPRSDAARM